MAIVGASNQQTVQACLAWCAGAAVVAPLLGLLGNEPRRIIALAGSGAVAIGAAVVINGFRYQSTTYAIAGVAAVLAVAPARAAAGLPVSAAPSPQRAPGLAGMGAAGPRLRRRALRRLGAAARL